MRKVGLPMTELHGPGLDWMLSVPACRAGRPNGPGRRTGRSKRNKRNACRTLTTARWVCDRIHRQDAGMTSASQGALNWARAPNGQTKRNKRNQCRTPPATHGMRALHASTHGFQPGALPSGRTHQPHPAATVPKDGECAPCLLPILRDAACGRSSG